MSKYVCCPRRGYKVIEEDGSVSRNDWLEYESDPDYTKPQLGELVIEFEYNKKTDIMIPRIKFGDGEHNFTDLPYMSADSFVLPTQASVTVYSDKWEQALDENNQKIPNRFYQYVTVQNATITPYSRVDLQPSPEQLVIFRDKDITFTTVNANGNVRVCLVGQPPVNTYTMQTMITEVSC